MTQNRRRFLQQAGLAAMAGLVPIGIQGWAAKSWGQLPPQKRLIVVFLRGAVDGLSVVVPHQEAAYFDARPSIALPKPGEANGVLDLDGQFGLHPALADLMPLWQEQSLAFVHACGSPDATRSHFEAQDYMEMGTPGIKTTADGWMNRLLASLPETGPTQAVNLGSTLPRILVGSESVASLPRGKAATRPQPLDRPRVQKAFDRLYTGTDGLSQAYREGRQARETLLASLEAAQMADPMEASRGAPTPLNFAQDARRLAQLMVGDADTQLAFLALGGWDTHLNQGNYRGLLARHLKPLGEGIATLVQELGPVYQDTVILVMSEFGRTVKENGNRGTDHGHGNVMWVLGGGIQGGQVHGDWPGLVADQLYEGRDLAITTDFRDAIAPLLQQHLQLNHSDLAQVFPNHTIQPKINLL